MPVVSVVIDPASGVDVLAAGVPKFGWLKDVEAFEAQLDLPIVAQLRDKNRLKMLRSKFAAPGPYRMSRPELP